MAEKIGITTDHAGYQLKEFLVGYLNAKGFEVIDYGAMSEESVDYPDFAHALARDITSGKIKRGVAMCGSGVGMSISLNRHKGIRAALAWTSEIAELSRQHNNSNVVVLPARFVDNDTALEIVNIWLSTSFEGERHLKRIEKIENL